MENRGNLELWAKGSKEEQLVIHAKFNRLIVMVTQKNSWNSIDKVVIDRFRCYVSNLLFF